MIIINNCNFNLNIFNFKLFSKHLKKFIIKYFILVRVEKCMLGGYILYNF